MNRSTPRALLSHADIRTIVIGVGVAMFLGALDQTIIAAALPAAALAQGPAAPDGFLPAEPPPLQEGMTGPVPAPDPDDMHQLVVMRLG